ALATGLGYAALLAGVALRFDPGSALGTWNSDAAIPVLQSNQISRADCESYFRTYYAPNNATLYLAGDFDPAQALASIRRLYDDIPQGPPAPAVINSEPEQKGERRAEIRYPAQAPSLMVGYRAPAAQDPDTFALDVLQFALSVGEGCRLNRELVYGKGIAVSAHMDWSWRVDPGLAVFYLELQPGADPRRAEQALYDQLDRLIREGLSAPELDKARNNLRAQNLRELSTNGGRAHALGLYEILLGSWRDGLTLEQRYRDVTPRRLKEVAARIFAPERRSVVTLVPESEILSPRRSRRAA
ncbi:MAG TPA: insulinase family protein, partial [Myxococcaceae bacterium]|nr:insulinase family protein [Myxococcaceae bacterium]